MGKKCIISLEEIKRLYKKGLSTGEIAREISVSPETVRKRLKKNGVELRSLSEALRLAYERGVKSKLTVWKWTKERTVEKLREIFKKRGEITRDIAVDESSWGLTQACRRDFGSFSEALIVAGLPTNYRELRIPPVDSQFAYWLGLVLGDGSFSNMYVYFAQTLRNSELTSIFGRYTRELFRRSVSVRREKGGMFKFPNGKLYTRKPRIQVQFGSVVVCRWLSRNFRAFKTPKEKIVPSWFLGKPPRVIGAFLSGFFDAEGSVEPSQVTVTQKSRKLLSQIGEMLGSLGIESDIREYKKECTLRIYGLGEIKKFHSLVGFKLERKNLALQGYIDKTERFWKNSNQRRAGESVRRILELLREGSKTREELAEQLGIAKENVGRLLRHLLAQSRASRKWVKQGVFSRYIWSKKQAMESGIEK